MSASRWLTWTSLGQNIEKSPGSEPPNPPKPTFEGFEGSVVPPFPNIVRHIERPPFPHCPRCASYALYRKNNTGPYECMTCRLREISDAVARREDHETGPPAFWGGDGGGSNQV
jgi:hypothetical protein